MSERITQELRDAMNVDREYTMGGDVVTRTYCMGRDEFADLCDAIDSIHANLERENDRLKCELDRVLGELDAKIESLEDELSHCIELPKDADGVPIHVGDLMDEMLPFGGYAAPAPIDTMELSRGAGGYCWMVKLDAENSALISPKLLRHHQPDSWERIIKDALTMPFHGKADVTQFVARCKALAGDAS